jgi:hypothetical protein
MPLNAALGLPATFYAALPMNASLWWRLSLTFTNAAGYLKPMNNGCTWPPPAFNKPPALR